MQIIAMLLGTALGLAPLNALAQKTSAQDEAVARLSAGERFYTVGEFEKAIVEFKAGALLVNLPVFSYNLGQCYRQLGNYQEAIWHFERYLARGSDPEVKADAAQFVEQMRAELESKAKTPLETPQPAKPPPSSSPDMRVAQTSTGLSTRRKLAIGIGAGGLGALGVGVVFAIRARGFDNDARDICPMKVCDDAAEARAIAERGADNALYANISLGVGIASLATGTVLWFLGEKHLSPDRVSITPILSPAMSGLCATGRF